MAHFNLVQGLLAEDGSAGGGEISSSRRARSALRGGKQWEKDQAMKPGALQPVQVAAKPPTAFMQPAQGGIDSFAPLVHGV